MSRQYRTAFNAGAGVTALAGTPLTWWLIWDPMLFVWPASILSVAYLVNLRGRRHRIRPNELKAPTKLTEDQILELQDIHFHMPREHRHMTETLLLAAYQQIERGNIDAVNPRLEKARELKATLLKHAAVIDSRDDIKEVEVQQRALTRALGA